jgi:glycerol uptake facilitator-like aquaporin
MLITGIFMFTDKKNGPAPPGVVPVGIFFTVLGISSALGMNTGAALNPARDLGPRILTAMVGWRSLQLQKPVLALVPYPWSNFWHGGGCVLLRCHALQGF